VIREAMRQKSMVALGRLRDAMLSSAKRFLNEYGSQLRPFETEYEVAPGMVVRRTRGHTPGTAWSAWRPAATG
jgi:hypothetical protein